MPRVTVLVLVLVAAPSVVLAQPWPVEFAARRCEFERALALLDAEKPVPKDQWEHGILRARLLLQLERSKEALATLAKLPLPRTKEQQADFFFLSGMALALGKELQRALEALEKARAAGVDASLIDGAAGMAYLTAGKVTEAEQALLRALKDDPLLAGALYNLACLRAGQSRVGEAAALVRQAWHLGLKNPLKLAADPALAALRSCNELIGDLTASDEKSCPTF